MIEFNVKVVDGDVYINDNFVAQLCYDNESVGTAVSMWLNEKDED